MSIRSFTYLTGLALMLGWILWIGRPVLVPIIAALISVYILSAAAEWMAQFPILGRLPSWIRQMLALMGFAVALVALFSMVVTNLAQVVSAVPRYEENLDVLLTRAAGLMGVEGEPTWETLRRATFDRVDMRAWITPILFQLQGVGTTLFLVVLYAAFFMAERGVMATKLVVALGGEEESARARLLIGRINDRIGRYLSVKTLVNIILGAISYALMLILGIEFALFWAVLIGFLNYIPYLGSLLGVIFPVLLSLAQFGQLWMSGVVMVTLTAAQMFVGGYLEPRMMGRAFNLSPFAVLLALSVWSGLWGLAGAVLAVPMTASLVLVLAEIRATRPAAVMLSANGRV